MSAFAEQKNPNGVTEEHLTQGWTMVIYGIPVKETFLRNKLRWICKRHGLWGIDRGGSVYVGPAVEGLDVDLQRIVEELRLRVGAEKLVHYVLGDYADTMGQYFLSQIDATMAEDMSMIEQSLSELEKALVGDVKLTDKDGKPRNLVTTGMGRIDAARKTLEAMETVAFRFERSNVDKNARQAELLRVKISQVRAWLNQVDIGFRAWCKTQLRLKSQQRQGEGLGFGEGVSA